MHINALVAVDGTEKLAFFDNFAISSIRTRVHIKHASVTVTANCCNANIHEREREFGLFGEVTNFGPMPFSLSVDIIMSNNANELVYESR